MCGTKQSIPTSETSTCKNFLIKKCQ